MAIITAIRRTKNKLTPVELAALFHYRYIRIHPFEDGNGRIARPVANYILARHGWPMVVVRNKKKSDDLKALHQSDLEIGSTPNNGANAGIIDIRHFQNFFKATVAAEPNDKKRIYSTARKRIVARDGYAVSITRGERTYDTEI